MRSGKEADDEGALAVRQGGGRDSLSGTVLQGYRRDLLPVDDQGRQAEENAHY